MDPEAGGEEDKAMSLSISSDTKSNSGRKDWLPYKRKPTLKVRLVHRDEADYRQLCQVRITVFVEEQEVPLESEFIEEEEHLSHNFGLFLDEAECVGTCRLRLIEPFVKLERVAILKEHRGQGYGEILLKHVIETVKKRWPRSVLAAHAQTSSLEFYRKLGAFVVGPRFWEEGIEHRSITFQWYQADEDGMREWILCGDPEKFAVTGAHVGELFDIKVLQNVRAIAEDIESARIVSPLNIIRAIDSKTKELGLVYNALRILISRAYAVDEDFFDQNEPSLRKTYEEVRKMADHKLNVGVYAEIEDHWRLLYAAVDITGSVFFFPNNGSRTKLSTENSYRELSLKALDSSVLKGRHIFSKKWLKDRVTVLKENLPPLDDYHIPSQSPDPVPPSLPNSFPVDSVDIADFDTEEEFTSYVYSNVLGGSKPIHLKNFLRCPNEKWGHTRLHKLLAYRSLPVEVGFKYTDDRWRQMICTGQEFFEMMKNPSVEGPAYMAQYGLQNVIPELAEQINAPEFVRIVAEPEAIEINLWIGPQGTVSPLHRDPKDNVFCQHVGSKFIRLISPEDEKKAGYRQFGIHKNTSSIDVEQPDLNLHASFADVACYDTIIKEGDGLFIPRGWFHHVRSLEPSTSINYWLPSPEEDEDMYKASSSDSDSSLPSSTSSKKSQKEEDEDMDNEEEEESDSEPEVIE